MNKVGHQVAIITLRWLELRTLNSNEPKEQQVWTIAAKIVEIKYQLLRKETIQAWRAASMRSRKCSVKFTKSGLTRKH